MPGSRCTWILLTIFFVLDPNGVFGRDCRVDVFPTQGDFDAAAYQGRWYTISMSRYWLEIPFISEWFPPSEIQAEYTANEDGDFVIQSGASGMLGMFGCLSANLSAVSVNKDYPQKKQLSSSNTVLGWFIGSKPYWILRTDYTGFAVIYGCWKREEDGTCDPSKTLLWTLNRDPDGHTEEQMEVITAVVEDACVDPNRLKVVSQTGKCDVKEGKLPKDEM